MTAVLVKSTLILVLTAGAARALRRESAAIIHVVWTAGLLAALALPAASLFAPAWSPALSGTIPNALDIGNVSGLIDVLSLEDRFPGALSGETLAAFFFWTWVSGAALGLGVLLAGAARLAWLVIGAEPVLEPRWTAIAREIGEQLGLRRPVEVFHHPRVRLLGTWGVLGPRVLVPSNAVAWNDDRIRMVLAHELAHVGRRDWPVQILAEAARAIYWFNPLFWLAASRLRQESEHASDDAVLRMGFSRTAYAESLLDLSRSLGNRQSAPVLAITPSFLERRLLAVLNPRLKRIAATPWAVGVIVFIAVGVTLPLAAFRDGAGREATAALGEEVCPVTPTATAAPPDGEMTAAFGDGPWFVNDNRSIWVWGPPYVAGVPINTIWIRPEGTVLSVTGERLDDEAPALDATIRCCYPLQFKTLGMVFPTPGCWNVTATAGDERLMFVTEVLSPSN